MKAALFVLALLGAGFPRLAAAASLTVNPIRLNIDPAARATSLTVTNQSDDSTVLQVRVFHWNHEGGADALSDAAEPDAPIVTPAMFRLSGRAASQVVRIGFDRPPSRTSELRWRVVVEELPHPAPAVAGDADGREVAVVTRLRVSLPLVVRPELVRKAVEWSVHPAADGGWVLDADNRGTVTERFDRVELSGGAGVLDVLSGPIYVFPAERRSFPLLAAIPAGTPTVHMAVLGTVQPLASELQVRAQ